MGLLNVYKYMSEKTVKLSDCYQVFLTLPQSDFEELVQGTNTDIKLFTTDGGTQTTGDAGSEQTSKNLQTIEWFECTKVKLPTFKYKEETLKYGNMRRNILIPDYQSLGDLELTLKEHYNNPDNIDSDTFDPLRNNNTLCVQSYIDLFLNKLFDMEHFAYKLHDYIPKIEIRITSNDFTRYQLVYVFENLKLTSYDSYTLDYTAGSPLEYTLSFSYQGYHTEQWVDQQEPAKPIAEEPKEVPEQKPGEAPVEEVTPEPAPKPAEQPAAAAPTAGAAEGKSVDAPDSAKPAEEKPAEAPAEKVNPPDPNDQYKLGDWKDAKPPETKEEKPAEAAPVEAVDPPAPEEPAPTASSSSAEPETKEPAEKPEPAPVDPVNPPDPNEQYKLGDWKDATAPESKEPEEKPETPPVEAVAPAAPAEEPKSAEQAETPAPIEPKQPKTATEAAQALDAAKERYANYNDAERAYMQAAEANGGSAMLAREKFRMANEDEFNASLGGLYQAQSDYSNAMKTEKAAAAAAAMGEEAQRAAEQAAAVAASNGRGARIPASMYGPQDETTESKASDAQILPEDNTVKGVLREDMAPAYEIAGRDANSSGSDGHTTGGGDAASDAYEAALKRAQEAERAANTKSGTVNDIDINVGSRDAEGGGSDGHTTGGGDAASDAYAEALKRAQDAEHAANTKSGTVSDIDMNVGSRDAEDGGADGHNVTGGAAAEEAARKAAEAARASAQAPVAELDPEPSSSNSSSSPGDMPPEASSSIENESIEPGTPSMSRGDALALADLASTNLETEANKQKTINSWRKNLKNAKDGKIRVGSDKVDFTTTNMEVDGVNVTVVVLDVKSKQATASGASDSLAALGGATTLTSHGTAASYQADFNGQMENDFKTYGITSFIAGTKDDAIVVVTKEALEGNKRGSDGAGYDMAGGKLEKRGIAVEYLMGTGVEAAEGKSYADLNFGSKGVTAKDGTYAVNENGLGSGAQGDASYFYNRGELIGTQVLLNLHNAAGSGNFSVNDGNETNIYDINKLDAVDAPRGNKTTRVSAGKQSASKYVSELAASDTTLFTTHGLLDTYKVKDKAGNIGFKYENKASEGNYMTEVQKSKAITVTRNHSNPDDPYNLALGNLNIKPKRVN